MTKILIVDDSAFARNKLRICVEQGGHEVVGLAKDGEQALDLFKTLHPELVILDYLMPNKNGIEILREVTQIDPDVKVIMVSGTHDHTIEEKALKDGAKVYVEKLRPPKDLLKAIDKVVGN